MHRQVTLVDGPRFQIQHFYSDGKYIYQILYKEKHDPEVIEKAIGFLFPKEMILYSKASGTWVVHILLDEDDITPFYTHDLPQMIAAL